MDAVIKEIGYDGLGVCLEVIKKSFSQKAEELCLDKSACYDHPAFLTMKRLSFEFENGVKMFGLFKKVGQIGFAGLDIREREIILTKLCVVPGEQNKGYGKALVEFSKHQTKVLGGSTLSVIIAKAEESLIGWFESQGFEIIEERTVPTPPYDIVKLSEKV